MLGSGTDLYLRFTSWVCGRCSAPLHICITRVVSKIAQTRLKMKRQKQEYRRIQMNLSTRRLTTKLSSSTKKTLFHTQQGSTISCSHSPVVLGLQTNEITNGQCGLVWRAHYDAVQINT